MFPIYFHLSAVCLHLSVISMITTMYVPFEVFVLLCYIPNFCVFLMFTLPVSEVSCISSPYMVFIPFSSLKVTHLGQDLKACGMPYTLPNSLSAPLQASLPEFKSKSEYICVARWAHVLNDSCSLVLDDNEETELKFRIITSNGCIYTMRVL